MAQHTAISQCIADTYIDDSTPNTNYGNSNILRLKSANVFWNIIFMKFAQANIPERKRIISAKLYLYLTEPLDAFDYGNFLITIPDSECSPERWENWEYEITANKFKKATPSSFGGITLARISNEWIASGKYRDFELATYRVPPYVISLRGATVAFHSRENTNPPYIEIVYEDVPPDKPTPRNPVGDYKDVFATIRFEWDYNSSVGGTQKAFDLQWSTDQINWTTISQTTPNTYCDVPGGTFPTGNIYWRIRTYNEYDEVSPWSDIQSFYAVGAPSAPTISSVSAGTARPTVSWAAFNQQIYQLQILSGETVVYDSGEQPGINIRQHKVTAWLTDGDYTARIRIKNEYDMWSEWGSTIFTVSTAKPQKPSFSLQRSSHGIEINIQGTDGYALIYRAEYGSDDFICIGNVTGKYFHDCSVKSGTEYRYFVRAVSANETYADSDVKLIQAEIRHSLIAPISDLADIFEFRRSLNAPPKRDYTRALGGSTVEYEGRKYPVFIPDEHVSAGLALTFFLNSWRAVEKFMGLYDRKETVLYRDSKGRKIYGVLSGLSVEEEREGYTVSFVISQVDHDEEVEV